MWNTYSGLTESKYLFDIKCIEQKTAAISPENHVKHKFFQIFEMSQFNNKQYSGWTAWLKMLSRLWDCDQYMK